MTELLCAGVAESFGGGEGWVGNLVAHASPLAALGRHLGRPSG